RDLGDAWELIENEAPTALQTAAPSTSKALRLTVAALAIALAAVAGLAFIHFREMPINQPSGLFSVSLPGTTRYLMLSPDGRNLAFVSDEGGPLRVWVRPLDSLESRPLMGTDGALFPFWSPDGKNIGFFAQGKLKKISATGGPAETLSDAATPRGGTWN